MSGCGATTSARTAGRALRWGALFSALVMAITLSCAATALAVSGKPISIGTPYDIGGPPAVAVDSSGTAYIAWNNTKDLSPVTTNVVQYCVIPAGASACSHSGTLAPADGGQYIDNVQDLIDGSTVVILADVYGTVGSHAGEYVPEQEWQSTDGGATWSLVNGGLSVADGIINADTGPVGPQSAVIVPGTNVLGYGWNTAGGSPPTFNAFPLTSPPECSTTTCPTPYASLEPPTNPDQIGNAGGAFASQSGANPGVLGIFNTVFDSGPLGCAMGDGLAYAYGSGNEGPANDYNASPGAANSAWKVAVSPVDCDVERASVAGGPSGFGVVELNDGTGDTVYHPFDQSHMNFDTPQVTIADESELYAAASQDAAGGIYATYLGTGSGGPITLSYSSDAGQAWATNTLNPNTDGGADQVNSSVGPGGQGWVAWIDNGTMFAQQFDAADSVAAAVADSGTSNGKTVSVSVTCSTLPCTVTITITTTETVVVKASVSRKHSKTRHETVTLAKGTFTITKSGAQKLGVRLSTKGKQFLAAHHGRLKANILLADKTQAGVQKITGTLRITSSKHGK